MGEGMMWLNNLLVVVVITAIGITVPVLLANLIGDAYSRRKRRKQIDRIALRAVEEALAQKRPTAAGCRSKAH